MANVVTFDYPTQVARGKYSRATQFVLHGINADVAATDEVIVPWSSTYTYIASGEKIKVVSNNAADDSAGAGARTVTVYGLDANFAAISETFSLTGSGTTTGTEQDFYRVHYAVVATAGANGENTADIDIKNNAASATLCQIEAGANKSCGCIYTVPANYTLYVAKGWAASGANKATHVSFMIREDGGLFYEQFHLVMLDNTYSHPFASPFAVGEKCDIEIRSNAAGGGGLVAAGIEGWLEQTQL